MTRAITRIMLPIAFVCGVVFVGLGVPATFDGALQVNTLNGAADQSSAPTPEAAPSASSQGQQTITRGPVAALVSIKHLGTNGGGWFNANSTHLFENPGPISNILENILMALLPMGLIYTFGMIVNRRKQAATFFWVMSGFFLVFLVIAYAGEVQGNPLLASIGLDPSQGNLEGHELRFGQGLTALFVTSTTAFTTGFSEVMYMYTSMAANNGSAFAGIAGNTNWFNASGSLVLALGRYVSIILMLALAGSMAAKKEVPMTVGTMRTDGRLFGGALAGTVLIIGALTFFPILALGPIAEHYAMWAGQTFS
ncbi:MAG: potassium-transporting ATPase subunit KdpA [Chloroflexi bacterium]|nr:potassium-transporting ATPase subunit KdpA [Chloroflexota bacterium]